MTDTNESNKKMSEWIEMHLEMKAKEGRIVEDGEAEEPDVPEEAGTLPPRSTIFPVKRRRWTRIFYNSLFFLFVALVVGLLVWGFRFSS